MKTIFTLITFAFTVQLSFADFISKSQAKVEVEKANKEFKALVSRSDIASYLPYKKTLEADQAYDNATRFLDDSDYDEASYYAIRSLAASMTARALAEAWKAEVEILRLERDFYKNKVSSDKSWAIIALQSADLKRMGKSKSFKGKLSAGEMLGFKRAPRKGDDVPELSSLGKERLEQVAKVMTEQSSVTATIETWASRERRKKSEISEAYATKVKDFLIEKGVDGSRITVKAKGKKRRKDIIQITVKNVTVK